MGGNAFPHTQKVPRAQVNAIVEYFIQSLGCPEYCLLGSSGKKDLTGDIDIAISHEFFDFNGLQSKLIELLGPHNVNTKGRAFNQIYTQYADNNALYQVDFMLGDLSLLNYTHWSPGDSSQYTGSHRTELIKAVAKSISPFREFHNHQLVARVGFTLHPDLGLKYECRWCAPRKDGRGFTTRMTAVSSQRELEFHKTFPDIPQQTSYVVGDINTINQLLFGVNCAINDVNSYESVSQLILNNRHLCVDLIWKLYTNRLDQIGLPHPVRII